MEQCNCDELIEQFETSQLIAIVGAVRKDDGFFYAVKTRDTTNIQLFSTNRMLKFWAKPLINYLENLSVFRMPRALVHFIDDIAIDRTTGEVGRPSEILGLQETL